MTEIGDGFYYYDYVEYANTIDYVILSDGGSTLLEGERYKNAVNENYVDDIDARLTALHGLGSWCPLSIIDTVKAAADSNVQRIMMPATVPNATRKVEIGRLDHVIFKIKSDVSSDWTTPIDEQTYYAWYLVFGDQNPYKLDVSD